MIVRAHMKSSGPLMGLTKFLLCLALAAVAAHSAAAANASLACGELSEQFPNNVAYPFPDLLHANPSDLLFTYTVTHYWNAALGLQVPVCVIFPTGPSDVSFAVKVLLKYPDVPWAAKSGGHNANQDYSSAKGGVLISFRPNMQSTTLNADLTATVGPGSRWEEAVSALEPYGKALVGGRIGDVGVGGYILGGGLSFLSSQYGMACDMVVEFQVVLADGTITAVNATQNTDLFFAIKGGGNQFAIITSFKMKTVDIGQVWGGIKVYTFDKASAIINATQDFAANYPDTKAAIIPTFTTLLEGIVDVFFVIFFYDGPPPPAGVFDKFNAIQPLIDETAVQTYASLLKSNDSYGSSTLIRAQTLPCLPGDQGRDVLQHQLSSFLSIANVNQSTLDVVMYVFAIQPLPVAIAKASLSSGSTNTFGFDVANGDRIWMDYNAIWINPADQATAFANAGLFTQTILEYTKATYPNAKSTHQTNQADQYTPLFLNDGMFDQATTLFYKPDIYQKLKAIQQARDPEGFFSKRSGGFKFL